MAPLPAPLALGTLWWWMTTSAAHPGLLKWAMRDACCEQCVNNVGRIAALIEQFWFYNR